MYLENNNQGTSLVLAVHDDGFHKLTTCSSYTWSICSSNS